MTSRLKSRRGLILSLLLLGAAGWSVACYGQTSALGSAMPPAGASAASSAGMKPGASGTAPAVLPADFSALRLEPGDLLGISIYDTPEFSDAYRVDPAGNLSLPLCGKVKVEGLTSPEAAKAIEAALVDGQILTHPQVNVDVQQYAGHFVTVLGEVANPGRVTVIAPEKLSEILSQVGGLTPVAGTLIKIRHGDEASIQEEDAPYSRSESNQQTGSVLIRPGDTVVVPRTGIVYVLGAVNHPGGYVMQEDGTLNVAEALAMGGGTMLTAKTGGLRVIRRRKDGSILDVSLSYDGIMKGAQTAFQLQPQDIVYVPMSKVKATLTDATAILSAATSAAIYTSR